MFRLYMLYVFQQKQIVSLKFTARIIHIQIVLFLGGLFGYSIFLLMPESYYFKK